MRAVLAVLLVAFHVDEGGPQEEESTRPLGRDEEALTMTTCPR